MVIRVSGKTYPTYKLYYMKYLHCDVTFPEVPDEVTLCIAISGCQIHCIGCHSRELWKDKGTPLTKEVLYGLLKKHQGITCLCLMGGESDIDSLTELFMYAHKKVKTAWYCGLDMIPKDKMGIIQYLDFIKLGHYDQELGGLASPTGNQRFYEIEHYADGKYSFNNITFKFQKQNKANED